MFNPQELKNLQALMKRVDIKGEESMAHASLMVKINAALENADVEVEENTEEEEE